MDQLADLLGGTPVVGQLGVVTRAPGLVNPLPVNLLPRTGLLQVLYQTGHQLLPAEIGKVRLLLYWILGFIRLVGWSLCYTNRYQMRENPSFRPNTLPTNFYFSMYVKYVLLNPRNHHDSIGPLFFRRRKYKNLR